MADKKLSSVSAVSDASFVYAETSSGETVKISKADLASVVAEMLPKNNLRFFDIGEDLSFTPEGSGVSKTITTSVGGVWLVVISFRGDAIEHTSVHIFYNVGGNYGKSITTISNFNYTDKSSLSVSANDGYSGFTVKPTYANPIYGGISVACRKLNP